MQEEFHGSTGIIGEFDFFLACFCGLDGQPRGKLFRRDRFIHAINEGYTTATSLWSGQEVYGVDDLVIKPDLSSIRPLILLRNTAWVACDILIDGKPSPICARTILKRHLKNLDKLNICTGVEIEFSLGTRKKQSFRRGSGNALVLYDAPDTTRYLNTLRTLLEKLPISEPCLHNESDLGQYELTWRQANPLKTADDHFYLRYVLTQLAAQTSTIISFMPLRTSDCQGNGCHVHISFTSSDEAQALKQCDYAQVLCNHAPEFSALALPTINSLKRLRIWFGQKLQQGKKPQSIKFLEHARGELVRITRNGTTEYRVADGATNPYILQCIILSPFLQRGQSESLRSSAVNSIVSDVMPMPRFAYEAILLLSKSKIATEVFGQELVSAFLNWRLKELDSFYQNVTDWETSRFEAQR